LLAAYVVDAAHPCSGDPRAAGVDHIDDHPIDHAADGLVDHPASGELRIALEYRRMFAAEQEDLAKCVDLHEPGAQTIIDIVIVVGDRVGQVGELRFEARLLAP